MNNTITKITFLTTSKDKFLETKHYLISKLSYNIELININNINLQEIQGSSEQILLNKLHQACKLVDGPVLVEDSAFSVIGMNSMPGPYIKDFFTNLGNKKTYEVFKPFLTNNTNNFDAIDLSYIALLLKTQDGLNQDPIIWKGETYGNIVNPINEEKDEYNWCFFFIPEGENITYGEMNTEQKNRVSARKKSLKQLCEYLESCKNIC
jgi:inosine triphosphate pyrophosphatase